jgi:hypothetical protein
VDLNNDERFLALQNLPGISLFIFRDAEQVLSSYYKTLLQGARRNDSIYAAPKTMTVYADPRTELIALIKIDGLIFLRSRCLRQVRSRVA